MSSEPNITRNVSRLYLLLCMRTAPLGQLRAAPFPDTLVNVKNAVVLLLKARGINLP